MIFNFKVFFIFAGIFSALKKLPGVNPVQVPCASPRILIASGSFDNSIKILDLDEGFECVKTLVDHTAPVRRVLFSSDMKSLFSSSEDKTLKFWDVSSSTCVKTMTYPNTIEGLALSPEGDVLAIGGQFGKIILLSVKDGSQVKEYMFTDTVWCLKFSLDGQYLFGGSEHGNLVVINRKDDKQLTIKIHEDLLRLYNLAITDDSKFLITVSDDLTAKITDIQNSFNVLKVLNKHTGQVWGLALSPDGKLLATGSCDFTIIVYSFPTGELLKTLTGHTDCIISLAFSPNGQYLISGSNDKSIRIWDLSSFELVNTFLGHSSLVNSIAIGAKCINCIPPPSSGCPACNNCKCKNNLQAPLTSVKPCVSMKLDTCSNCEGNINCDSYFSCNTPQFFSSVEKSCVNECPKGQWGNSITGACENCNERCSSCIGSGNLNCLSCQTGYFLKNKSCLNSDECTSASGWPDQDKCLNCDSSCQKCSGPNSNECLTCPEINTPFKSPKNECLERCPSRFYGDSKNVCQPCDSSCLSCSGPSQFNCTSCPTVNTPYITPMNQCLAACPEGFFANNQYTCKLCDIRCKKCEDSGYSKCQLCSSGYYLKGSSCLSPSECMSASGWTQQNTENICANCDSSCLTCFGPNSNNCATCLDTKNPFKSLNHECLVKCPIGTYGDNKKDCKICNNRCVECQASGSNSCSICSVGFFLKSTSCLSSAECTLANGWPESSQGVCLNCDPSCLTCLGPGENNCSSCPEKKTPYKTQSNQCLLACPEGFYSDAQKICKICDVRCKQCLNSGYLNCQRCSTEYYLKDSSCLSAAECKMISGLPQGNLCVGCDFSCLTCFGPNKTNCLTCPDTKTPFKSENYECLEKCPNGFYGEGEARLCRQCHITCGTCANHTDSGCLSCNEPRFLSGTSCVTACPAPLLGDSNSRKCEAVTFICHYSCKTCSGPSYQDCITCSENRGDSNNFPIEKQCECPSGTFDYLKPLCLGPEKQEVLIYTIQNIQQPVFSYLSIFGFLYKVVEVAQEINLYSFLKINKPLNLESLLEYFATFRLWTHISFLSKFFSSPGNSTKKQNDTYFISDQDAPTAFSRKGFSTSFLINASTELLILIVAPLLLLIIFTIAERCSRAKRKLKTDKDLSSATTSKIKKSFVMQLLRKLWENRQVILLKVIFALVMGSMQDVQFFFALQMLNISFSTKFNIMSFICSIVWLIYELIVIIYLFRVYLKSNPLVAEKLSLKKSRAARKNSGYAATTNAKYDPEFKEKFSFFFGIMVKENYSGMSYYIYRMAKKIILPLIHILYHNNPESVITNLILFYVFSLLYLRWVDPFEYRFAAVLSEATELLNINFLLFLKFYINAVRLNNSELALALGLYMIYCIMALILLNTASLLISLTLVAYTFIWDLIKKRMADKRKTLSRNGKVSKGEIEDKELEMKIMNKNFVKNNVAEETNEENKPKAVAPVLVESQMESQLLSSVRIVEQAGNVAKNLEEEDENKINYYNLMEQCVQRALLCSLVRKQLEKEVLKKCYRRILQGFQSLKKSMGNDYYIHDKGIKEFTEDKIFLTIAFKSILESRFPDEAFINNEYMDQYRKAEKEKNYHESSRIPFEQTEFLTAQDHSPHENLKYEEDLYVEFKNVGGEKKYDDLQRLTFEQAENIKYSNKDRIPVIPHIYNMNLSE